MATVTYDDTRRAGRTGRAEAAAAAGRGLVRDRGAAAGAGRRRPVRLQPVPRQGDRRLLREPGAAADAGRGRTRQVGPMPRYLDGIGTLDRGARGRGLARGRGPGRPRSRSSPAPSVEAGAPLVQLNDAPERADLASYQAQRAAGDRQPRARPSSWRGATSRPRPTSTRTSRRSRRRGPASPAARRSSTRSWSRRRSPASSACARSSSASMSSPGDTLVTLTDLDQLYANFTLPEQDRAAVAVGQPVELRVDAYPGRGVQGRDHRDRAADRPGDPRDAGPGDAGQSRPPPAARHVRQCPAWCCRPAPTW